MVQQNDAELGADYTQGCGYNIAVAGICNDSEDGGMGNKIFF